MEFEEVVFLLGVFLLLWSSMKILSYCCRRRNRLNRAYDPNQGIFGLFKNVIFTSLWVVFFGMLYSFASQPEPIQFIRLGGFGGKIDAKTSRKLNLDGGWIDGIRNAKDSG
jgi:hypothetical protein